MNRHTMCVQSFWFFWSQIDHAFRGCTLIAFVLLASMSFPVPVCWFWNQTCPCPFFCTKAKPKLAPLRQSLNSWWESSSSIPWTSFISSDWASSCWLHPHLAASFFLTVALSHSINSNSDVPLELWQQQLTTPWPCQFHLCCKLGPGSKHVRCWWTAARISGQQAAAVEEHLAPCMSKSHCD